jgi:hypothetical protein
MQAQPVTDEAIDLELTLSLVPHCEADHAIFVSPKGDHPTCSTVATHRLIFRCKGRMVLICHDLADWLMDEVQCGACGKRNCIRVLGL